MKDLELKLRAAEDEVTKLEKSRHSARQTNELEALIGSIFSPDTKATLSNNTIRGTGTAPTVE